MPTMAKFTAAPNGVAAAALVHLESGDVNVFVHAIRIEAPVRNQQSQIHAVVQHVMKEVKGVDPSAQFLSNEDIPIDFTVPEDKAEFDNLFSVETMHTRAQDTVAAFVKVRSSKLLRDLKQPMLRWLSDNRVWIKRSVRACTKERLTAIGYISRAHGRAEDMDVIKRWVYDGINDQRADGDTEPRFYFDIGMVVGQFDGRQIRGETVCVYCVSEQRQQQRELLERFTGQMAEAGRPFVDFDHQPTTVG